MAWLRLGFHSGARPQQRGNRGFSVGFNTAPGQPSTTLDPRPYEFISEWVDVVNDGTVQNYLLGVGVRAGAETWNRLGLWVRASEPATFEVLSISAFPPEADGGTPAGAIAAPASPQTAIVRAIPNDVAVVRDFVYADYGDRRLALDLYLPVTRSEPLAVIVAVRGGGWSIGDKEGFGPMAAALVRRGLAAASIEYRASGEAAFPAAVHDTKAAVRWLRANAAELGLDPDAIGAIGGSAGAHLVVYVGVTSGQAELEGEGGNAAVSSHVSAVVGLATPADLSGQHGRGPAQFLRASSEEDPELYRFASPVRHVDRDDPPLLLIHSEADPTVNFEQSVLLARRYGAAGAPVEMVLLPDAPHAFWNYQEWFAATMDRAARFFHEHLGR